MEKNCTIFVFNSHIKLLVYFNLVEIFVTLLIYEKQVFFSQVFHLNSLLHSIFLNLYSTILSKSANDIVKV